MGLLVLQAIGQKGNGTPVYHQYKGISIGMAAADVRAKLGEPRDKSDTQDFYVFSDSESAQVIYGPDKKVSVVSVNYIGTLVPMPAAKDIFGEDAAAKDDGSIFKLVRYPSSGFWVSYHRTAGDDPMVIVTMQKLPPGQK